MVWEIEVYRLTQYRKVFDIAWAENPINKTMSQCRQLVKVEDYCLKDRISSLFVVAILHSVQTGSLERAHKELGGC